MPCKPQGAPRGPSVEFVRRPPPPRSKTIFHHTITKSDHRIMSNAPFETVYNAEMTCEGCASEISKTLNSLAGVEHVMCDVPTQTVAVFGTTPPSAILGALKTRNAILRGTGSANTAGVAILENFEHNNDLRVQGLARLVGLPNGTTFVDVAMTGVPPGKYRASVRTSGDVSRGLASTGSQIQDLGELDCQNGDCNLYNTFKFPLAQMLGRSMAVTSTNGDAFCGVVARSAGAWENAKYVCSCTGKTIWDEKADARKRGIN